MKVTPFRDWHLQHYEDAIRVPQMVGYSFVNDGRMFASGGTIFCEWGRELWIYRRPNLTRPERRFLARFARAYVGALVSQGEEMWASARPGQERWLKFLGMEQQETVETDRGPVERWAILSDRKEEAWP